MKATTMLTAQHDEIRSTLAALAERDRGNRRTTLDRLAAQLQLHTRIEERFFYPAVAATDGREANDVVLESREEHLVVDTLLARLLAEPEREERFQARLRVLSALLEEHVEEEVATLFPMAERLGDDRLIEVGIRMQADVEEVQRLCALFDRAALAAERTERWAGRWLDAGLGLPRRAVSAIAPRRLLGIDGRPSRMLATTLADAMPKWVVDGVFSVLVGGEQGNGRGGERGSRAVRAEDAAVVR